MSQSAANHLGRPPYRGRYFPRTRFERGLLMDLIAVLEAAPKGLRRWSVMRALRDRRVRGGYDIALKFEDEVERLFREFCVADSAVAGSGASAGTDGGTGTGTGTSDATKPFFRPKDTAGEVWAVDPARLAAFLASPAAAG